MASPRDFAKIMDGLVADIPTIVDQAMVLGMNQADALIQGRVFNDNKDISGVSFGGYRSESYKKKREKKGLQTAVVDFQFTGSLLKDVVTNTSTTGYRVILNSTLSEKKARGNEQRKGKKIFEISEDEEKECVKVINDYFAQKVVDGLE